MGEARPPRSVRAAMPADPCTGAQWRKLPTGHPSRLRAGVRSPPQVLGGTGGVWLLLAWSPVLRSSLYDLMRILLTRVQGVRTNGTGFPVGHVCAGESPPSTARPTGCLTDNRPNHPK